MPCHYEHQRDRGRAAAVRKFDCDADNDLVRVTQLVASRAHCADRHRVGTKPSTLLDAGPACTYNLWAAQAAMPMIEDLLVAFSQVQSQFVLQRLLDRAISTNRFWPDNLAVLPSSLGDAQTISKNRRVD